MPAEGSNAAEESVEEAKQASKSLLSSHYSGASPKAQEEPALAVEG